MFSCACLVNELSKSWKKKAAAWVIKVDSVAIVVSKPKPKLEGFSFA